MALSDLWSRFQGHDITQRQITQKRYKIELYLYNSGPIASRIDYGLSNGAILNDLERPRPNPVFKVTLFFAAEYLMNG